MTRKLREKGPLKPLSSAQGAIHSYLQSRARNTVAVKSVEEMEQRSKKSRQGRDGESECSTANARPMVV